MSEYNAAERESERIAMTLAPMFVLPLHAEQPEPVNMVSLVEHVLRRADVVPRSEADALAEAFGGALEDVKYARDLAELDQARIKGWKALDVYRAKHPKEA